MKAKKKSTKQSARRSDKSKTGRSGSASTSQGTVEKTKLMKLFEDGIKEMYWVEKALTKALPRMAKNATYPELKEAIEQHLEETEMQAEKLEQVFELLGKKPQGKKCEGMTGILNEAQEMMKMAEKGAMRDAVIIAGGQKVEHYEISSYGTLRAYAEVLLLEEATEVLDEILEEEKNADATLTEIATQAVNLEAISEEEEEDEEEENA